MLQCFLSVVGSRHGEHYLWGASNSWTITQQTSHGLISFDSF